MRKVLNTMQRVAKNAYVAASTAVMMAPFTVQNALCGNSGGSGGTGWLTGQKISVNPTNVSGDKLMNNVLTIVVGLFVVLGLFWVITGILSWLQAHQEENSTAETKALKKVLGGMVAVSAPAVIKFLFT